MKNIKDNSKIEDIDVLLQKVTDLRVLYKKEKEELEYVDNDVDEGFIVEKMDKYASEIRKINAMLKDSKDV
jgi:hypothetical protein